MPILRITIQEVFRYQAEPICPDDRGMHYSLREVTTQEQDEIQRLQGEAVKLQALLKTIQDRDEFEFSHQYCSVCGDCVTCNLRLCRNGGQHAV